MRRFLPKKDSPRGGSWYEITGEQGHRGHDHVACRRGDEDVPRAPTPIIWLQNVVVDLLSGLGFHDAFRIFADHVQNRYGAEPGFITMNLPQLLPALESAGIQNPYVCSNVNKLGFRMSGGIAGYLDALDQRPFRAVAMSVFASGAIPAREAIEWVCGLPNLESIVFGASSRANIAATRQLIDEFWSDR